MTSPRDPRFGQPPFAPFPNAQPQPAIPPTQTAMPSTPYAMPGSPPQGAPAGPAPFQPQPGYSYQQTYSTQNPYAGPAMPVAQPGATGFGDRAGEPFRMQRGRYSAWPYVVIAFLMQIGVVAAVIGFPLGAAATLAVDDDVAVAIGGVAGSILGCVIAYLTFRDRWRCIEAFSSRFCSGLMNLSLLYVPVVAWGYANVRAVKKFRGQ